MSTTAMKQGVTGGKMSARILRMGPSDRCGWSEREKSQRIREVDANSGEIIITILSLREGPSC